MVATLSTCIKDVSFMLLQLLEEEFNSLINKKDQMNIETKIRNIRFIGELCKFKIASPGLVFGCLKTCLDDFSHHNIDVACNLLETCRQFLYRSPETSVRMANMLEILMRLKNVKNLDPHHSTLLKNVYYLCKPPERSARVSKVRPPLHQVCISFAKILLQVTRPRIALLGNIPRTTKINIGELIILSTTLGWLTEEEEPIKDNDQRIQYLLPT
ncbi:regulator of nonsense transcripts UPF2-like isoform X2 [Impatiens glandulifera]|uniref:regulator of nonsense transcripts UPF2-like isoform X2 n=2 Tax=Impatiens glandulifera TaxID=253017 RepID=UPI001FB19624|nr:regulator of nonsense transcripts UPF2-like isoform X2 [Impatiens glandulifera]